MMFAPKRCDRCVRVSPWKAMRRNSTTYWHTGVREKALRTHKEWGIDA